ncbi:hypothetical protein [Kutzneria buriramensis]|uniref:DUF4417 domain-containing protein n=1 Tax=Kutzneria buriramensis TaxID=1045776 RepID=A0A3E0GXL5_9PSEU|nr:hypothetical protein [Kutzneria buriramensis]REH31013.1 hypothetical protein BCF44_12236 [Kutzneria buriramensis]
MTPVFLSTPTLGAPTGPRPAPGCNCAVCDFWIDNPRAVEPICSGTSSSCEYCSCARAEDPSRAAVRDGGACRTCPIRCGSRPDVGDWIAAVGGTLRFTDLHVTQPAPTGLPRFIPMGDGDDIAPLDDGLGWPAYAVGMRRVLSTATGKIMPKLHDTTAHQAFAIPDTAKAILVGYGTDPLVEKYWSGRHRDGLMLSIAAQGWDLVLTSNYSMYLNQPRTEHLINYRRNLLIAAELADLGVPTAPCLYWARLEDLERYLDWVADTEPAQVAVNLQTFRDAEEWNELVVPGLAYLAGTLPADMPIWLVGASRPDRIRTLGALFGERLHLVAQNALQYARRGAVMTDQGRQDVHALTRDAFHTNVRYYADLLDGHAPAGGTP